MSDTRPEIVTKSLSWYVPLSVVTSKTSGAEPGWDIGVGACFGAPTTSKNRSSVWSPYWNSIRYRPD